MTELLNDRKKITELVILAERYALSSCGFCGHADYNYLRDQKFAQLIWEEAYSQGCSDGAEDAILKLRG